MENQFESLSDKLLFKIATKVYNHLSDEGVVIAPRTVFDNEITENITDATKPLGFGSTDYLEDEFLFEIIKLNLQDISNGSLSGQLVRPELKEYEFDTEVSETVYQTQTWRNTITSYGEPYFLIKVMDYNGDFEYYNGRDINTEIHDSETTEINVQRRSFRER
jgi:hypothetical protein